MFIILFSEERERREGGFTKLFVVLQRFYPFECVIKNMKNK
jgi:hypothetical protein